MVEKKDMFEDKIIDEVVAEPDTARDDVELADEEEISASKVKDLKAKLKSCEQEKRDNLDGWQRARADFLNYKRRTEEDWRRQKEQNAATTVESILPLYDSFALAMRGKAWDDADVNFKNGFVMIRSQLENILKELNVETVDPKGVPFDPRYHEAISNKETSDPAEHNTVIETIQPGYKIGATIIRPARVIVGQKN